MRTRWPAKLTIVLEHVIARADRDAGFPGPLLRPALAFLATSSPTHGDEGSHAERGVAPPLSGRGKRRPRRETAPGIKGEGLRLHLASCCLSSEEASKTKHGRLYPREGFRSSLGVKSSRKRVTCSAPRA